MPSKILSSAVLRLLRPLARLLLRQGMPFAAFAELAKRAWVEAAREEEGIEGRKQTVSRMSVLTGLSRKEVSRVLALPRVDAEEVSRRYHRAARVISGWRRDPEYRDAAGRPLVLPVLGPIPSFASLVRRHGADVPYRAVLDELTRVGAVAVDGDGVRLLVPAYLPEAGDDEKLEILGSDVAGLVRAIHHNVTRQDGVPWFQRKVHYDNLPVEALPEARALAARHGMELLELLDRWMAVRDRDENPGAPGTGRAAVGVGVFYFESNPYVESST